MRGISSIRFDWIKIFYYVTITNNTNHTYFHLLTSSLLCLTSLSIDVEILVHSVLAHSGNMPSSWSKTRASDRCSGCLPSIWPCSPGSRASTSESIRPIRSLGIISNRHTWVESLCARLRSETLPREWGPLPGNNVARDVFVQNWSHLRAYLPWWIPLIAVFLVRTATQGHFSVCRH